jgi:hypothetical protein
MGTGEDEDKQEVFQSHVTDMDTSSRSKVELVRMALYISVDTYFDLDVCNGTFVVAVNTYFSLYDYRLCRFNILKPTAYVHQHI